MSASENRDLYLLRHAMQSGVIDERTALARAYGLGLEAAAKVCEKGADMQHPIIKEHTMKNFGPSKHLARAIRALKEE